MQYVILPVPPNEYFLAQNPEGRVKCPTKLLGLPRSHGNFLKLSFSAAAGLAIQEGQEGILSSEAGARDAAQTYGKCDRPAFAFRRKKEKLREGRLEGTV